MRAALVAIVLAACGGRVPRAEPKPTDTPWCFRFGYTADGDPLVGTACWMTEKICAEAAGVAAKHGRLAHVTRVGSCEER